MNRESEATLIAEAQRRHRQHLMRVVSRDGLIDEEELALIAEAKALEERTTAKAEDELFAMAVYHNGRGSHRVRRLARQLFRPLDPSAA